MPIVRPAVPDDALDTNSALVPDANLFQSVNPVERYAAAPGCVIVAVLLSNKLVPRGALYMPASSERMLCKGPALGADAIIIDLEDSVAPECKRDARAAAVRALTSLDYGSSLRVLRLNADNTDAQEQDIAAAVAAVPDAVVLPKGENGEQIAGFIERLETAGLPTHVALWVMLESPAAVLAAPSIAACARNHARFTTIVVGNNDLSLAAGMVVPAPRTLLQPWLMTFVATARAGEIAILDGVYNDFRDERGFVDDCAASAACGMDGRTLIHPSQIAQAHTSFSPDGAAIEDARAVVAAFADPVNAGRGAVSLDGRMLELLHLSRAQKTLARAARCDDT